MKAAKLVKIEARYQKEKEEAMKQHEKEKEGIDKRYEESKGKIFCRWNK